MQEPCHERSMKSGQSEASSLQAQSCFNVFPIRSGHPLLRTAVFTQQFLTLGSHSRRPAVMSSAPSRLMLRQNRVVARRTCLRHASTTPEANQAASKTADKGKEVASNATSKASSGLSRVTSSAGSAMSGASQGVSNQVNKLGGRVGRLVNLVQC